jgi:hypothetical protein
MIQPRRLQPRFGRVVVRVDKEFEDQLQVGESTLYLDPSYRPLHHVQEFGLVVAIPLEMQEWVPSPCEVVPGDRVRFHYHSICNANLLYWQGERYWAIPYEQLYYVERPDGSVQMLNEYCLVDPVLTQGGQEQTPSGLITNLDAAGRARAVAKRGILRHAPSARSYWPNPARPGEVIAYADDADLPLEVNGHTYYLMSLREMLVVLPSFVL